MLVVLLGLAVVAGVTVGIVFLVKGGSGDRADAATMKAWEEYEGLLEEDGEVLARIDMQNTDQLFTAQKELDKARERVVVLQKTMEKTAGSEERIRGRGTPTRRDMLADAMAEALQAYGAYLAKVSEFLDRLTWAVANNQLIAPGVVDELNGLLADMQELAGEAKDAAMAFIKDNELLAGARLNQAPLGFAGAIAAKVEAKIKEAQAAEAARLEAERAAAEAEAARLEAERAAAERARNEYVTCPHCGGDGVSEGGDGWYQCPFCGGSGRVTREKANSYNWMDWI